MSGDWLKSMAMAGVLCQSAAAHDTLLLQAPQGKSALAGGTHLVLTSGMTFPASDYAIDPARIAERGCRVDGVRCDVVIGKRGPHALSLTAGAPTAIPGVMWIDLSPKTLILDEGKVREYFAEIDAPADIRASWDARSKPRRWRETYVKHAKALIGGGAGAVPEWSTPVGSALEIVPTSGTVLAQGREAEFEVIADGQPLRDFPVGAVSGPVAKALFLHTDANGRVRVPIGTGGDWLIRVTRLKPSSDHPLEWTSDFATLSFVVH